MTYIKNNKVLVLVIAVLLLSNIAMLYFYLNRCKPSKEPPKKNLSMREMMVQKLKNEVGFNDQQVESYKEMSDKHRQAMKPMFEQLRLSKDSLYKLLMQDKPSDSLMNYHLLKIGEKQKAIDQRIFSHFYALKQVCTAEQMPKYDSTIQKVIKGMIKGHK